MAQRPGYVPIPGSDALTTKARGHSAATSVEQAAPASLARVEVKVGNDIVVVGPVLLQDRSVPLLLEVMDRLGPLLSPESFVVYLQLYRLAVDDGKNACRVSLSELSRRTRLRDRRLGKAIADLVEARAVVLVDRTRDGTLYRVRLPEEIFAADVPLAPGASAGEGRKPRAPASRAAPEVSSSSSSSPLSSPKSPLTPDPSAAFGGEGRKPRAPASRAAPEVSSSSSPSSSSPKSPLTPDPSPAFGGEGRKPRAPASRVAAASSSVTSDVVVGPDVPLTPGPSPAFGGEGRKPRAPASRAAPSPEVSSSSSSSLSSVGPPRSVGDVCAWFAVAHGAGPGRGGSDVASVVMELLEEGWTFARIPPLFDRFVKVAPKTTPLRDLARVLKLDAPDA